LSTFQWIFAHHCVP